MYKVIQIFVKRLVATRHIYYAVKLFTRIIKKRDQCIKNYKRKIVEYLFIWLTEELNRRWYIYIYHCDLLLLFIFQIYIHFILQRLLIYTVP